MLSGVQESETNLLKYGISSPLQNYYHFNCSRQNNVCNSVCIHDKIQFMLLQDWSYDRRQLTYMRELGEGHFGKVLLMIAKV